MLILLSVITYMDRICISVAGTEMQKELQIDDRQWGWVLGAFLLSYGLFEIPTGAWGDRFGQRRVLTRVVVWWSVFTILTGRATGFLTLWATRFLFGAGEAGAYPNAAGSIGRWFAVSERARAQGFVWGASRLGGAITPLLVVPMVGAVGWRWTFYIFGAIGLVWAAAWRIWYRDFPDQHTAVSEWELQEIGQTSAASHHAQIPWKRLLSSPRMWLIIAMYGCYAWGPIFYMYWLPKYLQNGRGFSKDAMAKMMAAAFLLGTVGNLVGGWVSDHLTRTRGPRIGRNLVGAACLAASAVCLLATTVIRDKYAVAVVLGLGFGIIDGMLPCAWALCLDVGRNYAGAVSGAMNTAGQAGGFCCVVLYGYLIDWYGDYDLPMFVIAPLVFISSIFFYLINPATPLVPDEPHSPLETSSCD
jgi:MFS family permease